MSATRITRERQLPRTKRTSPSSVSSFFSVNKSSSVPLRSSKPAEMQDPTPRPRVRRPKRYAARKQPSDRTDVMAPALKAEEVPVAPIERPNVFTFMEEEQPEETVGEQDVADSKPEGETTEQTPEAPPYSNASCARSESDASEDSQRTRVEEYINQAISFHSDSGISVRASSSEHDSPVQGYNVPHKGPPVPSTGTPDAAQPTTMRVARLDKQKSEGSGREFDAEPEAYYSSARQLPFDMAYQHSAAPNHPSSPQSLYSDTRRPQTQQGYTKRGYDLLASNISSNDAAALKPLYRKFEAFNNRILLYLQDEIAEMEEELRQLDDAIAREGECMGDKIASRRAEARLPSHLQWCRLELLGRSFAKIEQYNQALSAYSNLTKTVEPASQADVATYRGWVAEHTPIADSEAKFLQNETDVLSVTRTRKTEMVGSRLVTGGFALLALVLVFKVTPDVLVRLVVSGIMGLAALCTLSPPVMTDFTKFREMGRVIALYGTVMLVLSVLIS